MSMISIDLEPDEPILDGRHLDTVIERWLDECRGRSSRVTVVGYENKIRFFREWWASVGPEQNWQISKADFQRFARELSEVLSAKDGQFLSYNTRKDALRRLRSALLWAYEKGYTRTLNCALWVPDKPEGSAPLHLPVSIESLAKLIWAAADMPFAARNQALLAVFIGTGARLSEVAGLSIEDVTFRSDLSGTMRIREAKKVKGREIHERIACFDRHTGEYLSRWLSLRGASSGPIWIAIDSDRLTIHGIYKAVKAISESAGVKISGCHAFRRTFVTYFASKRPGEGYYHLLQMQIGHAPQGTTRRFYDLRAIDDLQAAFVSPMEEIAAMTIRRNNQ